METSGLFSAISACDATIERTLGRIENKEKARKLRRAMKGESPEQIGASRQWVHKLIEEFSASIGRLESLDEAIAQIKSGHRRRPYYVDTRTWSSEFPVFYSKYLQRHHNGKVSRSFFVTDEKWEGSPTSNLLARVEKEGFPLYLKSISLHDDGTITSARFFYELEKEERKKWIVDEKKEMIIGRRSFSFLRNFCLSKRKICRLGIWGFYQYYMELAFDYLKSSRIDTPRRFAMAMSRWGSQSKDMDNKDCHFALLVSKNEPLKSIPFSIYEVQGWVEEHEDGEFDEEIQKRIDEVIRLDDAVEWRRRSAAAAGQT
jgi:hypothetical protein